MNRITFSAPGKIHLLGEHTVVYGKPAILAAVDLRVTVTVIPSNEGIQLSDRSEDNNPRLLSTSSSELDPALRRDDMLKKIIEPIIKKYFKIETIPTYKLSISSQIPIGAGLGSSAAISASFIAALLTFLKIKWDKELVNELTYQAEKVFHGNPSGGDNTAVVHGGLISYTKGQPIQPLPFSIPPKLAKNFVLIHTGKPQETTKEMVEMVRTKIKDQKSKIKNIFNSQEQLVKKLLLVLKEGNENELIRIIKSGEKNLESLGVVSQYVQDIIRKIEKAGGAAKICGGGGKTGPAGILLCYHPNTILIKQIAKSNNLLVFKTRLGVKGLQRKILT